MVRASVYYAASPGLNLAWCVFNMFSLADFFRQMVSKVHHLKILEFCSLFTGKTALENFLSIYLLHCYSTVYLLELSCELKTVFNGNYSWQPFCVIQYNHTVAVTGYYLAVTLQLHGNKVAITWQLHVNNVAVTW